MPVTLIDVYALEESCGLSRIKCADFSEAAAVCLDYHHHPQRILLIIEGDLKSHFELVWKESTDQVKDSRSDLDYAVESGAYCLAMLVVEKLTGLRVIKQSQKRTGFDYWLGKEEDLGIQGLARLEVSGMLKGSEARINRRLREKTEQTKKSDNLNLPAYIAVVEFSRPVIKIRKR